MKTTKLEQPLQQIISLSYQNTRNAFLIDRKSRRYSPKTYRFYEGELRLFGNFLDRQGAVMLDEITPDIIRIYLLELSQHRNAGGCHVAYRAIKTFFLWAWDELEMTGRNPISRVEAPKLNVQPLPGISLADIQKLVDACTTTTGARDKALFLFLLDTGCRAQEALDVNLADIDLVSGSVTIRAGKGGKRRQVFTGSKALRSIRKYLAARGNVKPDSPLFTTDEGTRLKYDGLKMILRRRAHQAGIEAPGAHDFRRAFCLTMLRNGTDLVTLQRLMGHADLTVLNRYLAQVDDDLQAAHRRASPADRL